MFYFSGWTVLAFSLCNFSPGTGVSSLCLGTLSKFGSTFYILFFEHSMWGNTAESSFNMNFFCQPQFLWASSSFSVTIPFFIYVVKIAFTD